MYTIHASTIVEVTKDINEQISHLSGYLENIKGELDDLSGFEVEDQDDLKFLHEEIESIKIEIKKFATALKING